MSRPSVVGHIQARAGGGRIVIRAFCQGCGCYHNLENVKWWSLVDGWHGEAPCGTHLVGQPENDGNDAA